MFPDHSDCERPYGRRLQPAGGRNHQRIAFGPTGILVRQRCFFFYRELSEELSGCKFRQAGLRKIFSKVCWPEKEELLPPNNHLRYIGKMISSDEIAERCPALRLRLDVIGLYDSLGGYREHSKHIPVLKQRVLELEPLSSQIDIPVVNANPYEGHMPSALGGRLLAALETADWEEYRVESLDFRPSRPSTQRVYPKLVK